MKPPFSCICFPDSGGDFLYLKVLLPKKWGDLVAFLRIFIELMVIRPGSHAAIALTVSKYLIVPFAQEVEIPDVANATITGNATLPGGDGESITTMSIEVLVAVILTIILTFINAYSMNLTKILCDTLSIIKVIVLLCIMILGFITIGRGNHVGLVWGSEPNQLWDFSSWSDKSTSEMVGSLVMASYAGQWSYAGWSDVNYAMEEIVDPSKNYPIASLVSMITVTGLYTGIVVGFYSVLTHHEIVTGISATTTLFVEKAFGFDDGSQVIKIIIAICVSLSTAGALHGSFFATSRLFFSGSRFNHLPAVFGGLHTKHHTPVPSLFILCILSVIYCFLPYFDADAIDFLINSTCFVYFLSIAACVLLLVIWRLNGRPNASSVLDKIEISPDHPDYDNTKVLMNVTNESMNESKVYRQEMTLDDVFTLPLVWHILWGWGGRNWENGGIFWKKSPGELS